MTVAGVEVVAGITSFGNVGCDQVGFGTRVDAFAEAFIDPFVAANDPDAPPPPDSAGEDGQGEGDDSPSTGSGSGPVSGGCTSADDGAAGSLGAVLVLIALVGLGRSRRARWPSGAPAARHLRGGSTILEFAARRPGLNCRVARGHVEWSMGWERSPTASWPPTMAQFASRSARN
jgi:MYXO-CTERM domain-containing protein